MHNLRRQALFVAYLGTIALLTVAAFALWVALAPPPQADPPACPKGRIVGRLLDGETFTHCAS